MRKHARSLIGLISRAASLSSLSLKNFITIESWLSHTMLCGLQAFLLVRVESQSDGHPV